MVDRVKQVMIQLAKFDAWLIYQIPMLTFLAYYRVIVIINFIALFVIFIPMYIAYTHVIDLIIITIAVFCGLGWAI